LSDFLVVCGEALSVMRGMPADSVDAIVTDPPYFRVKDEWWDRQWSKPEKFLEWVGELSAEWQRLLRPNGSLYCFASPEMSARVEVLLGSRFNVLNNIRWVKDAGWHKKADKEAVRSFLSPWESVILAEHYGADAASPLGQAVRTARLRAGMKATDVDIALGYVRTKDPRRGTELCRRWEEGSSIPSPDDFVRAMRACGSADDDEDLRREYEDLRRPFSVTADVPYTDVWDFPTVQPYKGKHPCEKPIQMMEHIVRTSTRPGQLVLDCFAGSGATGAACRTLGRRFVGIEIDFKWAQKARGRILQAEAPAPDLPLFASVA